MTEWEGLGRVKAKGCVISCVGPLYCALSIMTLVWFTGRFQSLFLQIISVNVLCLIKWKLSSDRKMPWLACKVNNTINPFYVRDCSQTTKFCRVVLLQFGLKIRGLARITGKDIPNEERENTGRCYFYVSPLTKIQHLYLTGDYIYIVSKLKPFVLNNCNNQLAEKLKNHCLQNFQMTSSYWISK